MTNTNPDTISILALVVSIAAVGISFYFGWQRSRTSRQANQIPALVDLFREHRGHELAAARTLIGSGGLDAFTRIRGPYAPASHDALKAVLAHQSLDRTARDDDAFAGVSCHQTFRVP